MCIRDSASPLSTFQNAPQKQIPSNNKEHFESRFKGWIRSVAIVLLVVFVPDQISWAFNYNPAVIWNKLPNVQVVNTNLPPAQMSSTQITESVENLLGQIANKQNTRLQLKLCLLYTSLLLWLFTPLLQKPDIAVPIFGMCLALGYLAPDFWLKGRIKKIKEELVKDLPDTVDLLALCVNAGLDFMMALKYLVEKSRPSMIMNELAIMMQEINVGKPRREALRSFSKKYELPDISTFARTLIQADRMGTSVSEALNILSEDMREARLRRGEAVALKAPLKMLIPLLLFIFPVVGILVAGPIFLEFFQNNPLQSLTAG